MHVLITGVTGFVGRHLAQTLISLDHYTVHGWSRSGSWGNHPPLADVTLDACDLTDADDLPARLKAIAPDWIFHLAGYANAGRSFHEPQRSWEQNLTATQALLYSVAELAHPPRVLLVSTGLVYGDAPEDEVSLNETAVLRPASPYAASKAAAEMFSYQMSVQPGLDIVRVRPFNHIGPGQSSEYALSNFARQIVAIENALQPPRLRTGNLSAQRDFLDVRDMVRAYIALLEHGQRGEVYNAGSGSTHCIEDVLHRMLDLSRVRVEIVQQIDPHRRVDTRRTCADARKLRRTTGWTPELRLDQSLQAILDWWRGHVDLCTREPTS